MSKATRQRATEEIPLDQWIPFLAQFTHEINGLVGLAQSADHALEALRSKTGLSRPVRARLTKGISCSSFRSPSRVLLFPWSSGPRRIRR